MTNLYALIVGIEKYDLPNGNRSGPVAGAIEMAYWCNSIGMPFKNIHMFLSINDQDAAWEKERKVQLAHFKKSGAKIVEDSKLDAIDTFWREKLPKIANGDSKLFVYWCGHGVTRPDRDRVFLHTDYNPRQLSGRVTSFNNFRATLATQAYHKFQEQLIVADVCGDFREQVSPNALPPANPVDSITQHCYFASVDGQATQIQNGIGQFTQSTLEVLSEYSAWPNLDELKNRMDETFRNGSLNPFKISIRTPREDYDDSDDDSAKANDASLQPSSEDVRTLISTCNEHIKRNELDELFQRLEDFLAPTKSTAFDQERNSLQILQSDLTNFRMGELNGTLTPDTDTQRRILITKIQKLLKRIESKDAKQTNKPSNLKPSSFSSGESFSSDVIGKNSKEIASKGNQIRSLDSDSYWTGNGVVTSIEFTLDRPFHEFDESAFMSAFRQCTGIDAKKIRIASIRPGSTIVRVEGEPDVLQRVVELLGESKEQLHLFCQLTGLTSLQWAIDGRSYKLDVLQANELTPMTRYTNTDDKDAGRNTTYTIGIITALEKEYAAVKALLKDCKAEEKQGYGAGRRYVGGKISSILGGEHNVILALADMGNNVAATRATLLLNHFPTIETVLMVGIAGGVPSPKKPEDHVRLGDVVISNKRGVVQYDMIKLEEIRACPIPPSAEMIESVRLLGVEALLGNQPWNTHIESSLRSIGSERPADTTDILFDSNNPEMKIEHPVDPKRTGGLPRIFLGPIASANELLKDPVKRDLLRDHFGVKAVEMEGSGIADATWISGKGYLVIRGICDYCDIHKNDVWQEYASAVAAGYAVALIESMPSPFPVGADRIGAKRPSPSKGISIPIPERGTSTVTHNSEISSSQSPVPPKKPLEFFRLQVVNLLKGNDEVTKNFYNLLASDEERVKSDVVADHLVRLDDSNTTEYPLLRLRRLMKKLSDQRLILDHSYRTVFVSMMDILSVASFPNEDRDRMENAMLEVLRSNPEIGSKVQLTTALPEDVKRLLILTRLKLASQKFDDFAIDRILNNDYQEGESGSPLFEIVRPVIIPEPFILPPDGRSITSYYAEKVLETFNSTMPRTDFEGCLTHELKERKGLEGDGEVIALLLSNEASKNAQILQKAFPLLLVIVLQRENALRYDTVLLDRNEIEKMLKKMLRNPQK